MRSIKFAFFLCSVYGKFFQKVLIHSTDKVFFCTKLFVAYFIHLIHNFFYIVWSKVASSECAFDKTAFKRSDYFILNFSCNLGQVS